MFAIWSLAVNDLKLLLAERGAFVARLAMPIVFILVVGVANDAFQNEEPPVPVLALADRDGSDLSGFYVGFIADRATGVDVCGAPASPCRSRSLDVMADLRAGRYDYAVVVPAGFERSLLAGADPPVSLVFARNDPEQASRLVPLLESAGRQMAMVLAAGNAAQALAREGYRAEASVAAVTRAREVLTAERVLVTRETIELPDRHALVGFQQSVPGMGSMFVMMSVLAGASILVEERRRWTMQRTLIAPVSRAGYVVGKVTGRFVVGMAQYLVAVVTGLVIGRVTGVDFGSSPLLMAAVMVAFVLAVSAMSILLATLVTRTQQAGGLTTLLAVTLAPLGGAWWSLDIEVIPQVMRTIAVVSPFYWVMEGFRAAIHDLGFAAAAVPLVVLMGIAFVTGGIATARMARL